MQSGSSNTEQPSRENGVKRTTPNKENNAQQQPAEGYKNVGEDASQGHPERDSTIDGPPGEYLALRDLANSSLVQSSHRGDQDQNPPDQIDCQADRPDNIEDSGNIHLEHAAAGSSGNSGPEPRQTVGETPHESDDSSGRNRRAGRCLRATLRPPESLMYSKVRGRTFSRGKGDVMN